jgi:hypothetical protein
MNTPELEARLRLAGDWPAPVVDWKVEKGLDATGMEAVWVWVIVDDVIEDWDLRTQLRNKVRDRITELEDSPPDWVYVRFRLESEVEAE